MLMPHLRKYLLFFVACVVCHSAISQAPAVGVIDALGWSADRVFPLTGTCRFFDGQLLTPDECTSASSVIINFPGLWSDKPHGESGIGVATYALSVLLPRNHPESLALSLPQMYSSYKLWANGTAIAENGKVGKLTIDCTPQWRPQTVTFTATKDTLTLVLQIANFHHAKGGVKEPIYLGTAEKLNLKRSIATLSNFTETGVLLLVSLFFFIVYATHGRRTVTLYFALLCLTWSVRSVFSNLYLAVSYFPDFDWSTAVRIEYLTLYLTMIWAVLFLSQIFQFESNIFFKYGFVFCNLLFAFYTMFSIPRLFTQWLNFYLITSGMLLLYGAFTVIRAWVNERVGSGLLTISIILGLNIFAYDIFVYEGFSSYDPLIFSIGYVSIFVLMGWALSMYLGLIKSKPSPTTRLTYDDLYKNN